MPNVDLMLVIIALIGNLLVGLFTFYKNQKSSTNILFFIFTVFLSLYVLVNFVSLHQSTSYQTFFWVKMLMAVIGFFNFSFFLLIYTFPHITFSFEKWKFFMAFIFTSLLVPTSFFNLIFSSIIKTETGTISTPGLAMPFFILHVVIFMGGAFYMLIKKYIHSKGNERKQLLLFLVGTMVMYGATLLTNFVAVLLFNFTGFVGLLPLYSLFFVGTVSYAIIKHKFLDINLFVLRAITYTILIGITALLYSAVLFFIGNYLLNIQITLQQQLIFISITFIIGLSFPRLQQFIERKTSAFLYKDRYDTDEKISELNKIITSTFDLYNLFHEVLGVIKQSIKFSKASIIVYSRDGQVQMKNDTFSLTDQDISQLISFKELIIFDSLEEGSIKNLLRKYEIQIIAPLVTKNETIGIFLFGTKQSGDSYSVQDIQFLQILSDSLAVATENVRSYEEIKTFNVRLQKEIEEATKDLRDANQQLKELDNLKSEFVSLASHELRTPMAAIKGSLSTILEGYAGPISNETKEFLSAAYNENDRLIRLVNNLLNTSRIESGKMSFTITAIDINAIIQEVVKNMQLAVKEKSIFLKHESQGKLPFVSADEDKIKEVIINLIGNAIKFTSTGGITIKTELKKDYIQVSVADTGTGIHNEDFDLLFKKFSQVKRDQQYTKSYGGTGLGLYISQKIIEGLGGKIWLESEVGKGTTFFFTLPIIS